MYGLFLTPCLVTARSPGWVCWRPNLASTRQYLFKSSFFFVGKLYWVSYLIMQLANMPYPFPFQKKNGNSLTCVLLLNLSVIFCCLLYLASSVEEFNGTTASSYNSTDGLTDGTTSTDGVTTNSFQTTPGMGGTQAEPHALFCLIIKQRTIPF